MRRLGTWIAITIAIAIVLALLLELISSMHSEESGVVYRMKLDRAIEIFEKRFREAFRCVEEKSCNLYGVGVVLVAIPTHDNLYDIHIYVDGLNYTRGSAYRDTAVWRAELGQLMHHIVMLSYGISRGYEEWLEIEEKLGIHLDVGYGIYDRFRDTLSLRVDLPTFKYCNHVCGQLYLNASLYLDSEKYIVYQFAKLNLSYLIDRGYIKIGKIGNSYAYPVNPPAVIRFAYIDALFERIPTEMLNTTEIPLIISLHIATTNRNILENYLEKLELYRPLIEACLADSYISEVSRENLTKFVEISDRVHREAIQNFIKKLHYGIIAKLYPDNSMTIEYIENPHGGDYYVARWRGIELVAHVGALGIHIQNVAPKLLEMLVREIPAIT